MLAAGSAWQNLGAELNVAATAFNSQIAGLIDGPWKGPASAAMASVAALQVQWLTMTSALALDSAARAESAASAFETALTMTVPPEVVAANRMLLAVLVATNALGQNAAAIAATEGQYAQMWADDVAAMTAYAQSSASAARLTPFDFPGSQPAAAVDPSVSTVLADLGFTSPISFLTPINTGLTATSLSGAYSAWGSASHADAAILATQQQIGNTESRILQRFDQIQPASVAGAAPTAAVVAQSSRSAAIGKLSVPQAWTDAVPVARRAALASYIARAQIGAGEPAAGAGGLPGVVGNVSPAVSGRATVTSASLQRWERQRANETSARRAAYPAAESSPIGIADELRHLAALRDADVLTDDEFLRQKHRLLGQ